MRVYLSGAITNEPMYEYYFKQAQDVFEGIGYEVVNPAPLCKVVGDKMNYTDIIDICMLLMQKCDAIAMLPNWTESRGATLERAYAKTRSMKIYTIDKVDGEIRVRGLIDARRLSGQNQDYIRNV